MEQSFLTTKEKALQFLSWLTESSTPPPPASSVCASWFPSPLHTKGGSSDAVSIYSLVNHRMYLWRVQIWMPESISRTDWGGGFLSSRISGTVRAYAGTSFNCITSPLPLSVTTRMAALVHPWNIKISKWANPRRPWIWTQLNGAALWQQLIYLACLPGFQFMNKARGVVAMFSSWVGMQKEENAQNCHCVLTQYTLGRNFSICSEKTGELSNRRLPNVTIEKSIIVLSPMNHFHIYLTNDIL